MIIIRRKEALMRKTDVVNQIKFERRTRTDDNHKIRRGSRYFIFLSFRKVHLSRRLPPVRAMFGRHRTRGAAQTNDKLRALATGNNFEINIDK